MKLMIKLKAKNLIKKYAVMISSKTDETITAINCWNLYFIKVLKLGNITHLFGENVVDHINSVSKQVKQICSSTNCNACFDRIILGTEDVAEYAK